MNALLVLVDLQNDYLANPALEPSAGETVRRASLLLEGCRRLGVEVAHVRTTVSREDDRRMAHWKSDGRWLCEAGTTGHAPPPALAPLPGETVVDKTSFGSAGALGQVLATLEPSVVVVAGIHLHTCVRAAVLETYEHGIPEILVADDACTTDDPLHSASARRWMERRAARFAPVAEILAALGGEVPEGASPAEEIVAGEIPRGVPSGEVPRWVPSGDVPRGVPSGGEDGEAGLDGAARRCRAAVPSWRATPIAERADLLLRAAGRLEEAAEEIGARMAGEIGKPIAAGTGEVRRTATMLRAIVERALATPEDEDPRVRRRPLGVVANVSPWNSPVYITVGKIAPALVYGNTVLWKPAPAVQAISERVAALLDAPPGVLEVIAGGRRVAQAAMEHPEVDAVTITGGSAAGFAAQEICGRRRIPLQAELGGNNAALVWPDADLEHAAGEVAGGAFGLAGQRCTANRRVVVHADCRDAFLDLLVQATAALPWGDPHDPRTVVGPMLNGAEHDRVASVVERAGGGIVANEQRHERPFHPPTIVVCDDPAAEIVQHETFGPVLVVQTARDWDHAIALVNGVRQGLGAALFSASADLRDRFLDEAQAGILKIGTSTADAEIDVPFGGWKWSGLGPPEHGAFDRDFYARPQAVYRAHVPVA